MKRTLLVVLVGTAACIFVAGPARRVHADDETSDVQAKIHAPLDAVDCAASPPTITVLGLTIDISAATIDAGSGDSGGDDGNDSEGDGGASQGGDVGEQDDGGTPGGSTCADLVVGQTVEVRLVSDSTPLAASEVSQGSDEGDVSIQAPIQNVDVTGKTITVLGLTIDVSQANVDGNDDDSEDGGSQPVDLTQLMPGQVVEVQLSSSQAPFTATALEVKNFANQVEMEIEDESGNPVDDADEDMDVEVDDTVMVQNATPGAAPAARRVKKVLHLRTSGGGGSIVLSGLPTGRAKILVTRANNGVVSMARRRVRVRGNTTRIVRVRLHAMP
jgi:uncharacterized protein DUF5666